LHFPRVEEQITIRTWPKTIQQKLFFIRDYEILSASGELLAAATSAWLMMNMQTRRLVPPSALKLNLPQNPRQALAEPLEKLIAPANGEERLRLRASYSAIDVVGHVNNARYIEWICDAFPTPWHQQHQLAALQINYDREVHPEDEVIVKVTSLDGQPGAFALSGQNLTQSTEAFTAAVSWKDNPA